MKRTLQLLEKIGVTAEEAEAVYRDAVAIRASLSAQNRPSKQTFAAIGQIAEALFRYRHKDFSPRITCCRGAAGARLLFCEPPCGSNTAVFLGERVLFVDGGFACYQKELFDALKPYIPDIHQRPKDLLLTHADIDHCGGLDVFEQVFLNADCSRNFAAERKGLPGFREEDAEHAPYVRISKILSRYRPPSGKNFSVIGQRQGKGLFEPIGEVIWENLRFSVWQGAGGHIRGETVFIEERQRLVFSGDVFINVKEQTRRQREYNRIAPALLTSVDTDPLLAARERTALFDLLPAGRWSIFGGHGAPMNKSI